MEFLIFALKFCVENCAKCNQEKTPFWINVYFVCVFWLGAACSEAAAVCGGQRGQIQTASSSANERQASHEASRDVARFRELNMESTGGSSNYQTNLLWCIQLISYRFSINTFRVCKSAETWDNFGMSYLIFVECRRKKALITLVVNH